MKCSMCITILSFMINLLQLVKHSIGYEAPKLILISMDGFRYDYLDRLSNDKISNFQYFFHHGAKVKYVKNVFPSYTYPNHMSIISGLYPESHGVVNNIFLDKYLNDTFHYDSLLQNLDSRWFDNGQETIYVTNAKGRGVRNTGSVLWPTGLTSIKCVTPRIIPRAFWGNTSMSYHQRVDYIIDWFMNKVQPINLGLLYFDEPDETGHLFGPDSMEIEKVIIKLNDALGYLIRKLNETKLLEKMNIIITSDHGMIKKGKVIDLHDCVNKNWYTAVPDHGLALSVFPRKGFREKVLDGLRSCQNMYTYTKDSEQLQTLHYSRNPRIGPIVVEVKAGYYVTSVNSTMGVHGYDPEKVPQMRPFFIASGPAFKKNYTHPNPINMVDIYSLMCEILDIKPAANNGSLTEVKELLLHPPKDTSSIKDKLFETTGITFLAVVVLATLVGGMFCIGAVRQSRITARKRMIVRRIPGLSSPLRNNPDATALLQSEDESDDL